MTTPVSVPDAAAKDDALASFSQCHAGILSSLQSFRGLPELLEPAAKARQIAQQTLALFRDAVLEHHAEEERELFPAVLASASKGPEREQVQVIVDQLVGEHRQIEAMWSRLEPALKDVAKGKDSSLDGSAVTRLADTYLAHARYEEEVFLPMSQTILGRNSNHMAALGLSLHMRHAKSAFDKAMAHW